MYKLNVIAIVGIVAAVSLVVGMASPATFAQDNITMTMDDNMSSMAGNMTETESLPSANQTGCPGGPDDGCWGP